MFFSVILPISPGCPSLIVILKAFHWTSSRGEGGYHNVVAFMLIIFI